MNTNNNIMIFNQMSILKKNLTQLISKNNFCLQNKKIIIIKSQPKCSQ